MKLLSPMNNLLFGLLLLFVLTDCTKEQNNPLDPVNPDAFQLAAVFDSAGVMLTWKAPAVSGIAGYNIHRSEQSDLIGPAIGTVAKNVNSFVDQDVWHGHMYFYRLTARDGFDDESKASHQDSALTVGSRLQLSRDAWSPAAAGDSVSLHITNDSTICKFGWTAQSLSESWLTLPEKSVGAAGDGMKVKASANSTGSDRTGYVIVISADASGSPDTLTVIQSSTPSSGPQICLSVTNWTAPGLGGTSPKIIVSNCGTPDNIQYLTLKDSSWLTITQYGNTTIGTLELSADNNFGTTPRDAYVVVQGNGVLGPPDTVYVHQPRMVWEALGSGIGDPWDDVDDVFALTVYSDQLVAAGNFNVASGVNVKNIAAWDGGAWLSLGSGIVGNVYAVTAYDGNLIAGGSFQLAGGISASNMASWNGINWAASWNYWVNGPIHALTVHENILFGGGVFGYIDEIEYNNIAGWNGNRPERDLNYGVGPPVYSLTGYGNRLIVGGGFTNTSTVSANHIAAWTGTDWSNLGSGVNEEVRAVAIYQNQLFAGGVFDTAGGIPVGYIAVWDGIGWSPLGSGIGLRMNFVVNAITSYGGKLIVGGRFQVAGGILANSIASWDGAKWSSLGLGVSGTVHEFTIYNNQLVIGGWFTGAGGVPATNIAVLKEQE